MAPSRATSSGRGANLLAELGASATTKLAEYSYYGLDRLHAVVAGVFAYHAQTDALGNLIALTNQSRVLVTKYGYAATVLQDSTSVIGNRNRVRWKGALWLGPEVELYYLRNRWYEPRTGRFLSEDPIGLAGGINPYAFVESDPIDGADPMGLCGASRSRECQCSMVDRPTGAEPHIDWVPCPSQPGAGPVYGGDQYAGWMGSAYYSGSVTAAGGRPGSSSQPTTQSDSRLRNCLLSLAGTAISFGLDAAGVSLLNSVRTVREGLALRAFAGGVADRAGAFAGTGLGLRVGRIAGAAFSGSNSLVEVGFAQAIARPVFGALATDAPFEAPAWYNIARNLPVIGTGARLAESAYVCTGTSP